MRGICSEKCSHTVLCKFEASNKGHECISYHGDCSDCYHSKKVKEDVYKCGIEQHYKTFTCSVWAPKDGEAKND